jgi:hypothetical protein
MVALLPADTEEAHRQAQVAGFDHCLTKPLSAEALGELLPELLARRMDATAGQSIPAA